MCPSRYITLSDHFPYQILNNWMTSVSKCLNFFIGDDQPLAEFLIQKGALVNISNNRGETPLHYAARSGYRKLGKCFIRNDANRDATTDDNQTPLHYAVKFG